MIGNLIEKQESNARAHKKMDAISPVPANARRIFTYEIGQALETLGRMFMNIPPFNDHIAQSTGRMLVTIGQKLKQN